MALKATGTGIKSLLCETKHHTRILADGIEHDGFPEFGGDFPQNMDGFRFEPIEMMQEMQ